MAQMGEHMKTHKMIRTFQPGTPIWKDMQYSGEEHGIFYQIDLCMNPVSLAYYLATLDK